MISGELRIIIVFLCSLFSAVFVLPKLAHIARRIGLIDQPNHRKVHTTPRPLVGGIGIVIAATFSSLAFIPITGLRGFFLGLSVLLLIGFLDDFKEVGHKQKFAAQICATLLLIYLSDVKLLSFGDLLGIGDLDIPGGEAAIWAVTIFCIVGVINSINLIDGLDGLAGGIAFNGFSLFALHASIGGNYPLMLLNFAFAGAVLGFLKFNWHPSVLFMGDAGSLCVGFALGFMALGLTQGESAVMPPVAALLILAVPITDTIIIMSKRAIKGSSPFKPDKYHIHHIFMRSGFGRPGTVRIILLFSLLIGSTSLLSPVYKVSEYWLFAIYGFYFCSVAFASFHIPFLLRKSFKYRKKKLKKGDAGNLMRIFLGSFDNFKVFRKAKRHKVYLKLSCKLDGDNERYEGKVLDISSRGCMAYIKDLEILTTNMQICLCLPIDENVVSVTIDAEHIWVAEQEGVYYHGFRFLHVVSGHQSLLAFMDNLEKKNHPSMAFLSSLL